MYRTESFIKRPNEMSLLQMGVQISFPVPTLRLRFAPKMSKNLRVRL